MIFLELFVLSRWNFQGKIRHFHGNSSVAFSASIILCNRKLLQFQNIFIPRKSDFANKGPSSRSYGFSISQVQMWELDHKKVWAWKNLCLQIVVLEKILESPLDSREIKPVNSKGNQPWIFLNIHWKAWYWSWSSNTLATWFKEPTYWRRLWCWERLKAKGEGDSRGWDG